MNKLDALVAKCCIGGTEGNYAYADRVRAALIEYGNQRLEDAAKVADAQYRRKQGALRIAAAIRALKVRLDAGVTALSIGSVLNAYRADFPKEG